MFDCVLTFHDVQRDQDGGEREDPGVEECRDGRQPLHGVHPDLRQPVEGLQEVQGVGQREELQSQVLPETEEKPNKTLDTYGQQNKLFISLKFLDF